MGKVDAFYSKWSGKDRAMIKHDIDSGIRKAKKIESALLENSGLTFGCVVDYGCGYGSAINYLSETGIIKEAYGFDCSQDAIAVAEKEFKNSGVKYNKLPGLDIEKNVEYITSKVGNKIDAIMLLDLLEHIPDCKKTIKTLSTLTKYFIVKLPLEKSIFDNYVIGKEYPGINQSNGHLREFDVNDVYYFVRKLGLTPLYEECYIYETSDSFPRYNRYSFMAKILRAVKILCSHILPKKIFIRFFGCGGYYCIAEFEESLMLEP